MRKSIILCLLWTLSFSVFSQEIKPFELSAQTEPEERDLLQKDNNGGFYSIVKSKGNESSKSIYELVHYNQDLNIINQSKINLESDENVSYTKLTKNNFHVFITKHSLDKNQTTLYKLTYNLSLKEPKKDTLIHAKIGEWVNKTGKGEVDQTFDLAIRARQGKNFITPLEYRFYFEESKNGEHLLIYRYVYSQASLKAKISLFDLNIQLSSNGEVGIDRGYKAHGFKLNDLGELFIVKSNSTGKVAVIKYNIVDHSHKYIYIPPTNSLRTNIKVNFISNNILLVSALNKKNETFLGYTFAYFDFNKEKITHQHYYLLDEKLKNDILTSEANLSLEENKTFKHYELVDVNLDSLGNLYTVVERRELEINALDYKSEGFDNLKGQVPKMGQVVTSTLIFSKFDDYFTPLWTTYLSKYQSSDLSHGLNNSSYLLNFNNSGLQTFFYATSRKGVFLNELNVVKLAPDGEFSKKNILSNEESLTPVLPYCFYKNSSLIFVGKKGLLGKKTFITKYNLND